MEKRNLTCAFCSAISFRSAAAMSWGGLTPKVRRAANSSMVQPIGLKNDANSLDIIGCRVAKLK